MDKVQIEKHEPIARRFLDNLDKKASELFQVGDWVSATSKRFKGLRPISQIRKDGYYLIDNLLCRPNGLCLWRPKIGDWCVFWNNRSINYTVGKYDTALADIEFFAIGDTRVYSNIAPIEFIQTLKDTQ